MNGSTFTALWFADFVHSPLDDLADEYHRRCEAYDRIVCTGPIRNGEVLPASHGELVRINHHAHAVRRELILRAECMGYSREQMVGAIRHVGRHWRPGGNG